MTIEFKNMIVILAAAFGLNPCSNGMTIELCGFVAIAASVNVLILVLME